MQHNQGVAKAAPSNLQLRLDLRPDLLASRERECFAVLRHEGCHSGPCSESLRLLTNAASFGCAMGPSVALDRPSSRETRAVAPVSHEPGIRISWRKRDRGTLLKWVPDCGVHHDSLCDSLSQDMAHITLFSGCMRLVVNRDWDAASTIMASCFCAKRWNSSSCVSE